MDLSNNKNQSDFISGHTSALLQNGASNFKIIVLIFLITSGTASLYFGWDRGYIPGNKRALASEAMRSAIETHIYLDTLRSSSCLRSHSWKSVKAERKGLPGISYAEVPGLYSKTYLLNLTGRGSGTRNDMIKEKAFLADQGFYDREYLKLNTDKGPMEAVRFSLTWDGYLATRPYAHSKECFHIGDRELSRITNFTKLEEKVAGLEAWNVNYETRLVNKPDWVDSSEARKLFHQIKAHDRVKEHSVVLIRGENEWVLESIAYWQLSRSKVDSRNHRDLEEINKQLFRAAAPALEIEVAKESLKSFVESNQWRSNLACLPIKLKAGGDDNELASTIRKNRNSEFSANFFDMDMAERRHYSYSGFASELAVWNALQSAGFAEITPLTKGEYKYNRQILSEPEGLAMVLNKDVNELLGIRTRNKCIPFGEFDVELKGIKLKRIGVYEVVALGKLKGTPEWVHPIARSLPALQHALENGVLIKGWVSYDKLIENDVNSTVKGEWSISKLTVHYPRIQYFELPSVLQPILPTSLRTWPWVKAPINIQAIKLKKEINSARKQYPSTIPSKSQVNKQAKATSKLRNNHSVTISSFFERNYQKRQLIAEYSMAGAATPWTLSENYSSGRYYFEVQGITVGQFSFSGHANITFSTKPKSDHFGFGGIKLIKHGEQKLRSNLDIFGIAIDYDKGALFHHINGEWINGAPGDNSGLKLNKNTMYYPIFVATGNRQGRKGVYWDINLGRKGFTYEIPSGFKPYGS